MAGVLAIAGLALAVALFAREDAGGIVALVIAAGPGLVLAALFHVLPMLANAYAWRRLLPELHRPGVRILAWATWVRESVNGLLPVARIGGEIVAYRIVRRHIAHRSDAAASLVADMALSVFSQAGFALLGLVLLFALGHSSTATTQLLAGVIGVIPLGAGFVLAQRAGALGALIRILDRLFAGRLGVAHTQSLRFDQALRAVYARRRDIVACFVWQLAGWALGAGEIWLALQFLGHQRGVLDAVVIEALIQAVSSAAFIVPGALGVQEGAFVVIGAVLGIDATTALALATARRLRDVVIFFPGLIAWQWAEARIRSGRSASAPQSR
ncbi:MAG TPA: lysylphosphatidylglycerol synthase domain-containing protein [Casimicrobiaceae bacterium]